MLQIGSHLVGNPASPFLVAEIACSHGGSPWECSKLIEAASQIGADAIQLQIFRAKLQVPPSHNLRPILENLEMDRATWANLFSQAKETGLVVSAFVYDEESLGWVTDWDPDMYKLNSSDLNYEPMLEGVAKTKKPISLGTGASSIGEIEYGLKMVSAHNEKIILMHGVQDFPTDIKDSRLNRISLLKEMGNRPIGFADHTDGNDQLAKYIDLIAMGMGASVLEKHLTLDRQAKKTDYQASLDPVAWSEYAKTIRKAAPALSGDSPEILTKSDERYRKFQKKTAFSSRSISKGESLTHDSVQFMRGDGNLGIFPKDLSENVAYIAKEDIPQGHLLQKSQFSVI
jgi:N,N'-diacetyllegionaminate synthase